MKVRHLKKKKADLLPQSPNGKKSFLNKTYYLKRIGVDKKLMVLLLLQTLLLIIISSYTLYSNNQRIKGQENSFLQQLNSMVLSQAAEKIRTLDMATSNLVLKDNLSISNNPIIPYLNSDSTIKENYSNVMGNFTKETRVLFSMFPRLDGMYLYLKSGEMIAYNTVNFKAIELENARDYEWFQKTLDSKGKLLISDQKTDKEMLYGARSLIKIKNSFQTVGVIAASIRIDDINVLFNKHRMIEEQQYAIVTKEGKQLLGSLSLSDFPIKFDSNLSGNSEAINKRTKDTYYLRADYNEQQQIYCIISTPKKAYNIAKSIELVLILSIFTMIMITVFAIIIKSINTPIRELVDACKVFGKGDFSVRMTESETSDLGYLSSTFNQMAEKVENLIKEVYIKNITERELEIQMLRNQINPHFLYNTLENMRMTAYTQEFYDLAEMCRLLAEVLRYGVSDTNEVVSVKQEVNHVNQYIELQQRRFHYAIKINCIIDPMIMECKMIKILLQPIIENAINHAFNEFCGKQSINILGYRQNDTIVFEIIDNGCGMEQEKLDLLNDYIRNKNTKFHSIGLKNVNRRIVLYYGQKYGMTIKSELEKGTLIRIVIPIQEDIEYV